MAAEQRIRHECQGVRWEILGDDAELRASRLLDYIHDLDRLPRAQRIKRTMVRSVYRVPLQPGRSLIVKVFRARSPWERFKERFLRSQAGAEWAASLRLRRMGLPASRAIALGRPAARRSDVQAYLIVDAAPNAVGANAYFRALEQRDPPRAVERQAAFLGELARFVRRLHDRGVRHRDLHAGNILVRGDAGPGEERFLLIDLQRLRVGRPPGHRYRAKALARLLSTFARGRAGWRPQRAAFVRAYAEAPPALASRRLRPEAVERRMERLQAARLRSRARRCLKDSSRFAVEVADGMRLYHRRDYSLAEIRQLVDRPRGSRPMDPELPAVRTARLPGRPGTRLEVRDFPPPRGWRRLLGPRAPSRALRQYAAAHRHRLETRAGPRPVAAMEVLRGPARGRSTLVLERQGGREREGG
ncbi:MAG: lipopolysaccharide kinase InaA family protein [Candidatus Brocadiia bacterium]